MSRRAFPWRCWSRPGPDPRRGQRCSNRAPVDEVRDCLRLVAALPQRLGHRRERGRRALAERLPNVPWPQPLGTRAYGTEEETNHADTRAGEPSPAMPTRGCGALPRRFVRIPKPRSDGRRTPGVRRTGGPSICSSCDASGSWSHSRNPPCLPVSSAAPFPVRNLLRSGRRRGVVAGGGFRPGAAALRKQPRRAALGSSRRLTGHSGCRQRLQLRAASGAHR